MFILNIIIDHIKKIAKKNKLRVSTKKLGFARFTKSIYTQVNRSSIIIRLATGKAVAQFMITGPIVQVWIIGAIITIDINYPDSLDRIEEIIANLNSQQAIESEAQILGITTVYLQALDIR